MKNKPTRLLAVLLLLAVLFTGACGSTGASGRTKPEKEPAGTTAVQTTASAPWEEAQKESRIQPAEISVAGLTLMSFIPYRVYLEPTADCEPSFDPLYVEIEFESENYCHLRLNGESVALGRYSNDMFFDAFSLDEDPARMLAINGRCDTDCGDADFAIRVHSYTQGEKAPAVFGEGNWRENALVDRIEPEKPTVYRAGDQLISDQETYKVRSLHDQPREQCMIAT